MRLAPRTAILRIAAVVLAVLMLGTLVLLVHPVLITGRYYEITIRSVDHGPQGMITLTYDEVLSYGTGVSWIYDHARGSATNTYGWNSGSRMFPRWPRTEKERTWAIYLTTDAERASGLGEASAIRQRWLPEKGTYRLRPGDRLVLARWQTPDGKVFESTIEVWPEP